MDKPNYVLLNNKKYEHKFDLYDYYKEGGFLYIQNLDSTHFVKFYPTNFLKSGIYAHEKFYNDKIIAIFKIRLK